MPLLDHFHPPLHGPRRWEGFHHAWATTIAQQLNLDTLPPDYYAEPEISLGPNLEIDVVTMELSSNKPSSDRVNTAVWSPSRPKIVAKVDFAHLDSFEVRVYQDLGGAEVRAAIELVSPANKDREGSRRTFAAKCAGYLRHGIGVVVIDVVTDRSANLHHELFEALEVKGRQRPWESSTGLYAVAYRAVTVRKRPRVEAWPEKLTLGKTLPVLPLWLTLDLCVPLPLEQSYAATCRSLRIPA
jgi:Protein of unknown function (DUF4058)